MSREIIMIFKKDGSVQTKTEGFLGTACTDATKFLQSLGDVTDFKKTAAYYETTGTTNQVLAGQCGSEE